jgi:outer membrane murein-binding lipoprotein Lpp
MTDLIPAITTVGSVVASVGSAFAAVLAWRTKLQFSQEFKDAKGAQIDAANEKVNAAKAQAEAANEKVNAANARIDAINAQKQAEIEKIKVEIERKQIENQNLIFKIEDLERNTPKHLTEALNALKQTYETTLAKEIQELIQKQGENSEIKQKKEQFETELKALENQLKLTIDDDKKRINARQKAREAIDTHRQYWVKKAVDAALAKYPDLIRKKFSWDINDYFDLIYHCLVVDRVDLLNKSGITLESPIDSYKIAFREIRDNVTKDLPKEYSDVLIPYIDHLLKNVFC